VQTLAAIAVAAVAGLVPAAVPAPRPLAGTPLAETTGLRLLVADRTPFVLDVDSGRTTRIDAIPPWSSVLWVVGAGRGAVVVQGAGDARMYGVSASGRVADLGRGANVWPAAGGGAWIQSARTAGRCTLRRVGLDGTVLRRPRPFACATASDPSGGPLGLVVNRTRIVDPESGKTVQRTRHGVLAVAGRMLVLAGPRRGLTLLDARTGAERRLARPDTLQGPGAAAVDPTGRYVVLEYADPAWQQTGTQSLDLWLLDTRTAARTRLPGMPADVLLKATNMAWTRDGRLVLLGEDDRGSFVAVWRPREKRLAVRRLRLPRRESGSDSCAILG
jgi:hypothetical protein